MSVGWLTPALLNHVTEVIICQNPTWTCTYIHIYMHVCIYSYRLFLNKLFTMLGLQWKASRKAKLYKSLWNEHKIQNTEQRREILWSFALKLMISGLKEKYCPTYTVQLLQGHFRELLTLRIEKNLKSLLINLCSLSSVHHKTEELL